MKILSASIARPTQTLGTGGCVLIQPFLIADAGEYFREHLDIQLLELPIRMVGVFLAGHGRADVDGVGQQLDGGASGRRDRFRLLTGGVAEDVQQGLHPVADFL